MQTYRLVQNLDDLKLLKISYLKSKKPAIKKQSDEKLCHVSRKDSKPTFPNTEQPFSYFQLNWFMQLYSWVGWLDVHNFR